MAPMTWQQQLQPSRPQAFRGVYVAAGVPVQHYNRRLELVLCKNGHNRDLTCGGEQLSLCRQMQGMASSRHTSVAACHGMSLVVWGQRPVHELLCVHDLHQLRWGMPHSGLHAMTGFRAGLLQQVSSVHTILVWSAG